jgi:cytoskeletal protein CcmA (bactofilin family)
MWKRDQAAKPTTSQTTAPAAPAPQAVTSPIPQTTAPIASVESVQQIQRSESNMVNIGKSVVIKGDLLGSEDLTIEGQVEGTIELKENVLTIGPNGRIMSTVFAKTVIVFGTVTGDVMASEKVDIRDGATVEGDVVSPKVAIAEGAHFRGSVDMKQTPKKGVQHTTATTHVPSKPNGGVPMGNAQPRAAAAV